MVIQRKHLEVFAKISKCFIEHMAMFWQ